MTYKTHAKRINRAKERSNLANQGKQGYDEAIESLSAVSQLCKYTVKFLQQCQDDGIPFTEYELILRKEE